MTNLFRRKKVNDGTESTELMPEKMYDRAETHKIYSLREDLGGELLFNRESKFAYDNTKDGRKYYPKECELKIEQFAAKNSD